VKIVIVVLSEIRWQALSSAGDFEQSLAPYRWRAVIFAMEFAQFPINRRQFVGCQSWQFCKNLTNAHDRNLNHKSPRGKYKFPVTNLRSNPVAFQTRCPTRFS